MTKDIVKIALRHGLVVLNRHVAFYGSGLSNFYACKIEFEGNIFSSSEQLFMWMKAKHFKDEETAAQILRAETPRDAKYLGRKVKGFDDEVWSHVRAYYMGVALLHKFKQNKSLKDLLLDPKFKGKSFVEGSPSDRIWGVGIHYTDPKIDDEDNWMGLNLLGKVLDSVREVIIRMEG